MTKNQAIAKLQAARVSCGMYLQIKLQTNDFQDAVSVLMELADIQAQLAAISVEFEPEPVPPAVAQS